MLPDLVSTILGMPRVSVTPTGLGLLHQGTGRHIALVFLWNRRLVIINAALLWRRLRRLGPLIGSIVRIAAGLGIGCNTCKMVLLHG